MKGIVLMQKTAHRLNNSLGVVDFSKPNQQLDKELSKVITEAWAQA